VKDGHLQRRNMRSEFITRDDVIEQLREQGVSDLSQVRQLRLESDGRFSLIKMTEEEHHVMRETRGAK